MHRLRRNNDRFASRQDGGRLGDLRIACSQIACLEHELAGQKIFGVLGREPASIFGDADGNDFVLFFIDCVENGCGREQRDLVLPTTSAK